MTVVAEPQLAVLPLHVDLEADRPLVDVVVPVYNEAAALRASIERLHGYLSGLLPGQFAITIADNASTDLTLEVASRLADRLPGVRVRHLAVKGRGNALRESWSQSEAAVLAYMDVDLSTDLSALLPLIAPLATGHSDLAIGSRLAPGSRVVRGPKREFISRSYNLLLRSSLRAGFSDAQCGFKAIRADVAARLLPLVKDGGWFFDTELLVLAERSGLRIHEVPVDWVDDPDSRVDLVSTAVADVRGMFRVARALATGSLPIGELRQAFGRGALDDPPEHGGDPARVGGSQLTQLLRFGAIGVISTLAYLMLFFVLRLDLGAQAANLLALLLTAMANTAANRRLTFGVRGSDGAWRHQAQGLLVFAIGLALTSGSLWLLHAVSASPGRALELAVLVAANLAATLARFTLLRRWVFPSPTPPGDQAGSRGHTATE